MTKSPIIAVAIASLLIVILIFHSQITSNFQSIGIGGASTYSFVYLNTYDYPNLTQQPASVSWSYSANHNLGITTGTCNTNIELFNLNEYISELDAPTANFDYPLSQQYSSPSSQGVNIALCELSLPVSYYNSTQGTLTLQATGTNGWTSASYSASLSIESKYSAEQSGQPTPLIITLPLTNPNPTTTTTLTTSATTSTQSTSIISTINTTTSINMTTSINPTTTIITPPPPQFSLSQLLNQIVSAISNFLSSIGL